MLGWSQWILARSRHQRRREGGISMIVESLWITRRPESGFTAPELLVAWDEVSLDENMEGYQEECEKALAACKSDVDQVRYIQINVPDAQLDAAFAMATIPSAVIDYRANLEPATK